jgi:hypothetical protein
MGETLSSTEVGVGSSWDMPSCASEGATPQVSMTMKPIVAVRDLTAMDVEILRALNRNAQHRAELCLANILSPSSKSDSP